MLVNGSPVQFNKMPTIQFSFKIYSATSDISSFSQNVVLQQALKFLEWLGLVDEGLVTCCVSFWQHEAQEK